MRVCIVGLGNIGSILAAHLSYTGHEVIVYCSKELGTQVPFTCVDTETGAQFTARVNRVTTQLATAVAEAELMLITYPSFMIGDFVAKVAPLLPESIAVGIVPGSGGGEYIVHHLLEQKVTIFGVDRVPFISRLNQATRTVHFSRKKSVNVATIPHTASGPVSKILSELLAMPVYPLDSYLEVTLTPSNAILHTARVYRLFKEHKVEAPYRSVPLFYEEWDDASSYYLIELDKELERVMLRLESEGLMQTRTIRAHYESQSIEAMTQKITSIAAFKGIPAPVKKLSQQQYVPDWSSRYFIEDFPYGLCIIKGFAELLHIETPMTDRLILWAQQQLGTQYLDTAGQVITDVSTGVPQAYGLETYEKMIQFYKMT